MLRLNRHLFRWTGDAKYLDFYERALANHILGSQNLSTGEVTCYVPLKSGAKHEWQTLYNSFTCCVGTGTGMENHVKYGESIYFHDDQTLWSNLFIASELTWNDAGVNVRMDPLFPAPGKVSLTVTAEPPKRFAMKLRRPEWAIMYAFTVNGQAVADVPGPASYVTIDREWKTGDRVEIDAPHPLRTEPLGTDPSHVAVLSGPVPMAQKIAGNDYRTAAIVDPSGELLQSLNPDVERLWRTAPPASASRTTFRNVRLTAHGRTATRFSS